VCGSAHWWCQAAAHAARHEKQFTQQALRLS
jgi:hypothetical protein